MLQISGFMDSLVGMFAMAYMCCVCNALSKEYTHSCHTTLRDVLMRFVVELLRFLNFILDLVLHWQAGEIYTRPALILHTQPLGGPVQQRLKSYWSMSPG